MIFDTQGKRVLLLSIPDGSLAGGGGARLSTGPGELKKFAREHST